MSIDPWSDRERDVAGVGRYILNFFLAGFIGLGLTYFLRNRGWLATWLSVPIFIVGIIIFAAVASSGQSGDSRQFTREQCENLSDVKPGNIIVFDEVLTVEERLECVALLIESAEQPTGTAAPPECLPSLSSTPAPRTSAPARDKIAFASDRDGNDEIYIMNADGSGQTNVTNHVADDRSPAWSPAGDKIAFVSNRDGNQEIYVMNADGSDQTRLTNDPANDLAVAWSPADDKIAFVSDRDGIREIYVMNADGSGLTHITDNGADFAPPSWSPDGTRIAFTFGFRIYVMNADGSDRTRLTSNPTDKFPAWSPDGRSIAFWSNRDGRPGDIYVMNADGSDQARLTCNPAVDAFPAWSPDSTRIAFVSQRDGVQEIYVMNADGSGLTNLTGNPAFDDSPAWSPVP